MSEQGGHREQGFWAGAEGERALERYRTLVNTIDDGIYQLDADGRFVAVNDVILDALGYTRDELLGEHASVLLDDDQVARIRRSIRQLLGTPDEDGRTMEVPVQTADGDELLCELRVNLLTDDGKFAGSIGVAREVMDRGERERQLKRERNRMEKLLETTPVAVAVSDSDGETVRANRRAQDFLGLSEEEILESPDDEWTTYDADGDELAEDELPAARVRQTGEPVYDEAVAIEGPSGETMWFRLNAAPVFDDGELDRVITTGEDVTELKARERALEQRKNALETELSEILGRVSDGFFAVDENWEFTHVNDHAHELINPEGVDLEGKNLWEMFPAAADGDFKAQYERAMTEQVTVSFEEYYPAPLDTWFEVRAYPSETGLSVYLRDVSDRKEREHQLEQYETIVETINDGIYVVDTDGRFTMVNDAYTDLTGYSRDELLGEDVSLVVDDEIRERATALETALREGDARKPVLEAEVELASGETVTTEATFAMFEGPSGDEHRIGVVRDITERKQRERALEESERRYRTIAEYIPNGIVTLFDHDLEYTLAAGQGFDDITVDADELVGRSFRAVWDEETVDVLEPAFEAALAGEEYTTELEYEGREWLFQAAPITDDRGEVFAGMTMARDITERKERERELARYETIVETMNDGIYVKDEDGRFTMVNDAYAELTGYDRDTLIGEHASLVVDENAIDQSRERIDTPSGPDPTMEAAIETASGDTVPAEGTFATVETDGERQEVGVVRDITERKEYERRIEESERRYRTLAERFPDGAVGVYDHDLEYSLVAGELVGVGLPERDRLEGARMPDIFPEHTVADLEPLFRAAVEDGETGSRTTEFDGRHWQVWATPLQDDAGDVIAGLSFAQDVTEQVEHERDLELRARQQEIVADLGLFALETDDLDELMQEAARQVADALDTDYAKVLDLDLEADELVLRQGYGWSDAVVGNTTFDTGEHSQAGYTLLTKEPVVVADMAAQDEFDPPELLESRGLTSGISTIIGPFDDPWGILETHDADPRTFSEEDVDFVQSVATILADAIERERYNAQLEALVAELEESNERLEQFAYAASHDLQEPLRMVSSYLSLIERRYEDLLDDEGQEFLDYAVDGAERMREMIDALLKYSRVETRGDPFEPVDLESVVDSVLADYQVRIEETDADVTTTDLPAVHGDADQLRQVFGNLLSNALEYSGDGPPSIRVFAERDGGHWVVALEDDGVGIEPEHQDRVFEVFQRLHTQEEHGGTGIGLALAQRIVERHEGELWVESEPGEGSTFYCSLPVVEESDD